VSANDARSAQANENILALDPGGTIGYAHRTRSGEILSGQVPREEVWLLLTAMQPHGIVCESFKLRKLPKVDLAPVEVIGVVKEWARQNDVPIKWQDPAYAKTYFNDSRLKERGLHLPGRPHANDATRHLLAHLKAY
jgi:hypothetical protein